jgi:ABC-type molybdate transport system substrate-binding protein
VYDKIRQGFIILSHARKGNYDKAQMFSGYILSPAAKKIFKQFGYLVL